MKPEERGVEQAVMGEYCRCGVRLRDGDRVLWCPRVECPETKQRFADEWQRKFFKMDEPFDPFVGSGGGNKK